MWLYDTDTLSSLFRRAPSPQLVERIATVPGESQFTSTSTLSELYYGAYRNSSRTALLLPLIDVLVLENLTVLPFDAAAARQYGDLRAKLERAGTPLADADLRIASIALTRALTLVTANIRHFARVPGLHVENWLI
jgi:tRNA(fMet)-specific endonuclease VapC